MGKLTEKLDEFQESTRHYYRDIMEILEDEYCWKCPMRTNSKETLCREVESWIRLTESMEAGLREEFSRENYSLEEAESAASKFMEKMMKKSYKIEDNLIIKMEDDAEPYARAGDFLYVKTNPLRVKKGELVLMPRACPMATYWYIKTFNSSTVPFKIFKVTRVFQKLGCKYIETEDGLQVPLNYVLGVIKNIIGPDLSLQSWE